MKIPAIMIKSEAVQIIDPNHVWTIDTNLKFANLDENKNTEW